MAGVQSKLASYPKSLQVSLPANWRKLAFISTSLVFTFFLGRYVARKYYVKNISKVLTDETAKHDQARREKINRAGDQHPLFLPETPADSDTEKDNLGSQKISFSDPSTPSNHPSGLAQLVESSKASYRGTSLSELSSGRLSTRRRVASSLASTQINLSLRSPEELVIFGNEYIKRALKIWDATKNRIKGTVAFNKIKHFQHTNSRFFFLTGRRCRRSTHATIGRNHCKHKAIDFRHRHVHQELEKGKRASS